MNYTIQIPLKLCLHCNINPRAVYSDRTRSLCKPCRKLQQVKYRENNPIQKVKNAERMRIKRLNGFRRGFLETQVGKLNQRAKKSNTPGKITQKELSIFLKNQTFCQDCGSQENLTIGHMLPLFYPITKNIISNLIRQCKSCNVKQHLSVHINIATDELRKWYPIYVPVHFPTKDSNNE